TSDETSFPVAQGPGLTFTHAGPFVADAFVAKVKPDGSGLVYAGYIGGDGHDAALGIAVDSTGHAYVAGSTAPRDFFPGPVGPNLGYNNVHSTGFVAKVEPDGSGLVYAGYVGGTQFDVATAIAVDSAGNAYVAGATQSGNFPVKNGPGLALSGNEDAFVAKVKADGTGFLYAGYIGGEFADEAHAIAVDSAGNAYVAGFTLSDERSFPVKVGPGLHRTGFPDAFVAKVNPDGGLVWAGYLGGRE